MFNWFIFLFSNQIQDSVVAQIQIQESEIEAIYLPEGYTGPIVAAPFDSNIF
jgi:hypothetical protein